VSASPKANFVVAVIVPARDYILKRVAEIEGKVYRFSNDLDYKNFLDTHDHIREIF
jgi:hypothetical protein